MSINKRIEGLNHHTLVEPGEVGSLHVSTFHNRGNQKFTFSRVVDKHGQHTTLAADLYLHEAQQFVRGLVMPCGMGQNNNTIKLAG